MSEKSFSDILAVVNEDEAVELKIFKNATIRTLKKYQEEPTKANQVDYESARVALEDRKKQIEEKYFKNDGQDDTRVFPSLLAASEFLAGKGYKVSKSKIYRDESTGKITKQADGSVTALAAWEYAEKYLEKTGVNKDDLKDLQATKIRNAIRNQDIEYKRKEFELDRELGRYLPRRDFEAELAARAVILETSLKHLFNTRVGEWIALVGGHPNKSPDLLQVLHNNLEEELSSYASTQTFQVIFTEE